MKSLDGYMVHLFEDYKIIAPRQKTSEFFSEWPGARDVFNHKAVE